VYGIIEPAMLDPDCCKAMPNVEAGEPSSSVKTAFQFPVIPLGAVPLLFSGFCAPPQLMKNNAEA
jgi:hypothetical protein